MNNQRIEPEIYAKMLKRRKMQYFYKMYDKFFGILKNYIYL